MYKNQIQDGFAVIDWFFGGVFFLKGPGNTADQTSETLCQTLQGLIKPEVVLHNDPLAAAIV
jgi:hypothetical protein